MPVLAVKSTLACGSVASAGRSRGFTLIELVTTVVVLAVSLALAAPALSSFVRSNQLRAAQSELVSSLMLARSEAARRGGRAGAEALQPVLNGGFSHGWRVWVDANVNGTHDAGEVVLREVFYSNENVVIKAAARAVVFNANGFLVPVAPVSFDVQASSATKHYCIQLAPVGLADVSHVSSESPCV